VKGALVPLLSEKDVLNLKLNCIPLPDLKRLAINLALSTQGSGADIIKTIIRSALSERIVDEFIRQKHAEKVSERKSIISDDELKKELMKVRTFSWGIVQGQLDAKVQAEYVRKIVRYEELLGKVERKLHTDVTNYVVCTWFNHWTTVLIEEHIGRHRKVVPTIKNIKGVDIFFDGQPFDLKVTYVPRDYSPEEALRNPRELAVWMYENQGAQRFGADNRLFIVVLDKDNPEKSWELKRDFDLVFSRIDAFFDTESVNKDDEVVFSFGRKTYTALTKVLVITT